MKNLTPAASQMTETRYRRGPVNRENRRSLRFENARAALGTLTPGIELFILNRGLWSLVDLIEVVLQEIGGASVSLISWCAGGDDLKVLRRLVREKNIKSLRIYLDNSHERMKLHVSEYLIKYFGADAVRIGSVHAKITLLGNDDWKIVIRGSQNLNRNPRLEHCEISDDAGLYGFLDEFINDIWQMTEAGRGRDQIGGGQEILNDVTIQPASPEDLIGAAL